MSLLFFNLLTQNSFIILSFNIVKQNHGYDDFDDDTRQYASVYISHTRKKHLKYIFTQYYKGNARILLGETYITCAFDKESSVGI